MRNTLIPKRRSGIPRMDSPALAGFTRRTPRRPGPASPAEMVVRAEGGMSGIPRETLNLVVLEGLHQLGLRDVDVSIPQEKK